MAVETDPASPCCCSCLCHKWDSWSTPGSQHRWRVRLLSWSKESLGTLAVAGEDVGGVGDAVVAGSVSCLFPQSLPPLALCELPLTGGITLHVLSLLKLQCNIKENSGISQAERVVTLAEGIRDPGWEGEGRGARGAVPLLSAAAWDSLVLPALD